MTEEKASVSLDGAVRVGEIDPLIWGNFIEHTGRCVYGGVYAPGTPSADEDGFNAALIGECRDMKLPLVRYPGGSYISTWNWEDAIGPKKERRTGLNLPWHEMEPNQFGIGEAVEWARKVGCELMICVNTATGTIMDALHLLEYCNFPGGTYYSDLRRSHGYEKPFGIRYFSMGNEPDGWWQINLETAAEYARVSGEFAKAMKMLDPSIRIIACSGLGGSGWTEATLRYGYKYYDYLSVHAYFSNGANDFPRYMRSAAGLESRLRGQWELCDKIGAELESEKKLLLSFDEWNVWYHSNEADKKIPAWQSAPHRLEDVYNLEDALVVGEIMLTMMRCCGRIGIGCMAQLVNVIAPFMTDDDGTLLRQPTYYPYRDVCRWGRGTAWKPVIASPAFETAHAGEPSSPLTSLDAMLADDREDGVTALFLLNRDEKRALACTVKLEGFGEPEILRADSLYHNDIKAENRFDAPENAAERPLDVSVGQDGLTAALPAHSWNIILIKGNLK